MTHLEEVRKAVVERVPDIIMLRFGCEVRLKQHDWEDTHTMTEIPRMDCFRTLDKYGDVSEFDRDVSDIVEIIGRTIRLADVLLACEIAVGINAVGVVLLGKMPFHENMHWDLSKDSLDEQSPECLSFLHGILCK